MEEVYKLNRKISISDRKYSYSKVSEYLRKQQVNNLELSDDSIEIYTYFSSQIAMLNNEMFKAKSDHQAIMFSLNQIKEEVINHSEIDDFLQKYITIEILPKLAYCHYKLGQYSIAESYIDQQFSIGNSLIKQKAYFLVFNLMEQVLNLSKVLVAQNKIEQCVFNWTELFKFLILGGESRTSYFNVNVDFLNTGFYKILKEYSILNFLKVYISGHMQFGIYPKPNVIFRDWYMKMDVSSSERLAIFNYISLLESFPKTNINKLTDKVVEFTHLFNSSNFLILRCYLIRMLIDRIHKEYLSSNKKVEVIGFLTSHLDTISSKSLD